MRGLTVFLALLLSYGLHSQQSDSLDNEYLEDQFYVGITYNFLLGKPDGVSLRNLSYGLQGGFIKDIPLSPLRNIGLGIGLGYAVNSYYTNLVASETADGFEYAIVDDNDNPFKRNKIETHLIEMPIEFRWRNSTAADYKFWRVYAGIKLGYIVGSRSKFVSDTLKDSFYNTDTRNFQYGLMLNFGYNTFNIHAYYALNDLFDDGVTALDGQEVGLTPLRIGIIFYIL
ncbi:porin family protein [Poritiphilus flavus]|uniref:Outer membrane beta-barrel protein n=1 Tax=Poritiphilus flavus TaxID=2697053 RepID=A0A6L9E6S8_9FLAO|nr:porin family protein [Poritiphilus flavus]NAS10400.1 outer membrane beta-barrel protein [Poritiphilus flavus]